MEFDEPVDGFGAAVVGSAGGEVGEGRLGPSAEGLAEPGELGDRAGRQGVEELLGDPLADGEVADLLYCGRDGGVGRGSEMGELVGAEAEPGVNF